MDRSHVAGHRRRTNARQRDGSRDPASPGPNSAESLNAVSYDGFRFTADPAVVAAFEQSLATVNQLPERRSADEASDEQIDLAATREQPGTEIELAFGSGSEAH